MIFQCGKLIIEQTDPKIDPKTDSYEMSFLKDASLQQEEVIE